MNGLAHGSRRLAAALGVLGLLVGPVAASAQGGGGGGEGGHVYVPNQADATVSVADAGTRRVVATVDLREHGFSANAKPHDVVAAPDGSAWYVSLINDNRVVKFSPENRVLGTAEFEVPGMLSISPSGDVLYVGRSMSAVNPPQRIGRIETADMSIEEIEVLYARPHAIVVGPEGEWVHSASLAVNRIATIEGASGRVTMTGVDGPTHVLVQMDVSPDGSRLVATGQLSNSLLVFDRTNLPELAPVATVEVGTWPWHPVFTPDGRYVVFGNKKDDTVTIVDAESWEVAAVVEDAAIDQPHGAAATPDGRFVYVSNNNLDGHWRPEGWEMQSEDDTPPGNVVVIDVEAAKVVGVIPVGHDPNGIGFRPAR